GKRRSVTEITSPGSPFAAWRRRMFGGVRADSQTFAAPPSARSYGAGFPEPHRQAPARQKASPQGEAARRRGRVEDPGQAAAEPGRHVQDAQEEEEEATAQVERGRVRCAQRG